jgi:hypothetical protein
MRIARLQILFWPDPGDWTVGRWRFAESIRFFDAWSLGPVEFRWHRTEAQIRAQCRRARP